MLAIGLMSQSGPPVLKGKQTEQPKSEAAQEEVPPEEDSATAPKEYAFNPLQANKEVRIGDYYMKRGKPKAAAERYREATKWNPQFADAFRKLGEAEEKQEDGKAARAAYERFLEIKPDDKSAAEVRKHLEKLPAGDPLPEK